MSSCLKIAVLAGLLIVASPGLAKEQDYLYVSGKYSQGFLDVQGIEQRVFDDSEVKLYQSGTYKIELYENNQLVSQNFFEIVEGQKMEVVPVKEGVEYGTFQPNYSLFAASLPLTKSISAENSRLQIKKSERVLFSKNLSELPLEVLAKKENLVSIKTPELSLPPFPKDKNNLLGLPLWLLGIIVLIVLIAVFSILFKKRRGLKPLDNVPPVPPQEPSQDSPLPPPPSPPPSP